MKRTTTLTITATLAFVSPVFAQFTGDGFKNLVVGSKHDLSANANVSGATAVCEFCHAPHKIAGMFNGAGPEIQPPLLWNIQVRPGPYAVYGASSTLAAAD